MADPEQIQDLRKAFFEEIESKGITDTFHPKDLERVKNDDSWVGRFFLHMECNQKEAVNMMKESLTWRKQVQANEINSIVKQDLLASGGFFPHGRDKDGSLMFIFKSKKYVKGSSDVEELRKCVIYWFERLERQGNGKPITLFFDMEGCGLANMDMEFTRYLIGLFKQYYPFFLNYILIFEMPWILNAAFKIIKSWLPEKAVQKIKFVSKKDIKEFVPLDEALVCWGGQNEYVFRFVPEEEKAESKAVVAVQSSTPVSSNRKVHFADGSSMSESPEGSGEKDHDGSTLCVQPSSIINFVKDGNELVSTLELQNTDSHIVLTYKLKTTAPEKFRVRPSVGCLTPGARATINVTVLQGFQIGSLSRDKFLVMSTVLQPEEINGDLAQIWKDTSGRKVYQHRLKCAHPGEGAKNGNAVSVSGGGGSEGDRGGDKQLLAKMSKLMECQAQLHKAVKRTQQYQVATVFMVLLLGVVLSYILYLETGHGTSGFCRNPRAP